MITLQAFNGSASLTALLLGAAVSERNQSQKEIARACRQLAEMVAKIATDGHHHPKVLDSTGERARDPDGISTEDGP
jgi:hypothetical protein